MAVTLGLSLFVVVEVMCWAFGWGEPTDFDDPFVGFSNVHPLFVLKKHSGEKTEEDRYEIPQSRLVFFAKESFPAKKSLNTFRIFCLGGSTVQGRPFSTPTSFSTWLRISLESAEPDRNWEVVNCGGISYASYRLVPILNECLRYQPDLFVICTGHNEFLEDRTYEDIKYAPAALNVPHEMLARYRTYALLRSAVQSVNKDSKPKSSERAILNQDVDALLDYEGGLQAYHRDDQWRRSVQSHYTANVTRMLAISRAAGVPVVLIRPPSNLSDCPPFKSENRSDLSAAEQRRWRSLVDDAKRHYRSDLLRSIERLQSAIEIDGRCAATYFELGKCYETTRRPEQAREMFRRARDEDICPLRILSSMEAALLKVARQTNTPLIDAHQILESRCRDEILGNQWLVDHIHPTFKGHQVIANELMKELQRQGQVKPQEDFERIRQRAYEKHVASLGDAYYLHGQRTLESLRGWAAGRADGPPVDQRWNPNTDWEAGRNPIDWRQKKQKLEDK